MKLILVILFYLMAVSTDGQDQVRLITPGEHLGFKLEYFNKDKQLVKTTISQGEAWTAIYVDNDSFFTKTEKLTWDTAKNFTIYSDTTEQPKFYVQGLRNIVKHGQGTGFSWKEIHSNTPLTWIFNNSRFTILYRDDPNLNKLADYQYGSIKTDNELVLFKNVKKEQINEINLSHEHKVQLLWTGDLNNDKEPDFFLLLKSHHEMPIYELIISLKDSGKTKWKRIARFTEWF